MRSHLNRTPSSPPLRNEVEATDNTDHSAKAPLGFVITLFAGLQVLCCALLVPLLAGASLAALLPSGRAIGAMAALVAFVSFVRYVWKRNAAGRARRNAPGLIGTGIKG